MARLRLDLTLFFVAIVLTSWQKELVTAAVPIRSKVNTLSASQREVLQSLRERRSVDGGAGGNFPVPEGPLPSILKKNNGEDFKTGYIRVDHAMRDVSKNVGQKVRLLCDISGDPWPSYMWKVNGRVIGEDDDSRISTKRELFGSSLFIKKLLVTDSANYTCIASNPYGERQVSAILTVRLSNRWRGTAKGSNQPRNKKTLTDSHQQSPDADSSIEDNGPKLGSEEFAERGFCQTFTSTACKLYIGNNPVYVEHNLKQAIIEPVFLAFFRDLNSQNISDSCLGAIIKASCFYSFPLCHTYDGIEVPKRLCQNSCTELTDKSCRNDIVKLRHSLPLESQRLLPNCSTLPNSNTAAGSQCIRVEASSLTLRNRGGGGGGDDSEMLIDSPNFLRDEDPPKPRTTVTLITLNSNTQTRMVVVENQQLCYNATGATYRGSVAHSRSGRPCIHWRRLQGYHTTFDTDHAFCRNPLAREQVAPWCFVTEEGERELCDIPRCLESDSDNVFLLNKDVWPVFVTILVIVVLAVLLLLMCCCFCRRTNATGGYRGIKKVQRNGVPVNCAPGTVYHTNVNAYALGTNGSGQHHLNTLEMQFAKIPLQASEFSLSRIRFGEELGQCVFGKVYKGELVGLYGDTSVTQVVLKTLHISSLQQLQTDFRREANVMAELSHPNVLCLLGVNTQQTPWCMIFELMSMGDLHEFLMYHNPHSYESSLYLKDNQQIFDVNSGTCLTYAEMLHISNQVAAGMEYLASRHFVHRDLATRNVLVGEQLLCKISDFGFARDKYVMDYYRSSAGALLPIRWMSPEAILRAEFTLESDTWSFGVFLWEVWSFGAQPYYGHSHFDVIELVRSRQLLPCPEYCPTKVYALMMECWNELPQHRPQLRNVAAQLRALQTELLSQMSSASHSAASGGTGSTGLDDNQYSYQASSSLAYGCALASDTRPPSQRVIPLPMPLSSLCLSADPNAETMSSVSSVQSSSLSRSSLSCYSVGQYTKS